MPKISKITCHKIVNSKGNWTVATEVHLDDGSVGEQTVPSGTSTGLHEAHYLPVEEAIDRVTNTIGSLLEDANPYDQDRIDSVMIDTDNTPNKAALGGNSILSVSLAVAKAAANSKGIELYDHIMQLYGNKNEPSFPSPVFNILNGGLHAQNNLSFQEFMVIPAKNVPYDKAYEMGVNIYHKLKFTLARQGYGTGVGDEGGFAPSGFTVRKALELIRQVVNAEYNLGEEVFLGIDVAADSFRREDSYEIKEENLKLSQDDLHKYYLGLLNDFELIYLEDPFFESHYSAWGEFYKDVSNRLMLVADDLAVTNPQRLKKVIDEKLANAVIVKPNQVGSLSETLKFIKMAKEAGMSIIVSHRSGDTAEDTFIADLAVAVNADFIKSGAPARGERVAKYNRLLELYYLLNRG